MMYTGCKGYKRKGFIQMQRHGECKTPVIPPGGGGRLHVNFTRMCLFKSDGHGSFFRAQVSEMSGSVFT